MAKKYSRAKRQENRKPAKNNKQKIIYTEKSPDEIKEYVTPTEKYTSGKENVILDQKLFLGVTAVFAAVIIGLIISQIVLFGQTKKYTQMYEQQLSVNHQLEALIEALGTDVSTAGDELPVVSGVEQGASNKGQNRGTWAEIPPAVREKMQGVSMEEDSPVSYDDLAYLTVPYYDFDGKISSGHVIVAKDVADEVLDIFEELFNQTYPIESMEIIEEFDDKQTTLLDTTEAAARGNNNTFGFYYKKNAKKFTANSYGKAVEVNPRINPRVDADGSTMPKNALKYTDRSISLDGTEHWAFIGEGYDIVKVFEKYGWTWGGADGGTDYGHFEKTQ